MSITLDEILETLGPEGERRTDVLSREVVRRWVLDDDIEVLGALCHLLDSPSFRNRIQPPLTLDEHQALFLHYFERCVLENPDGEWADNRYQAGWNLVGWFNFLWKNKEITRKKILEIKRLLGKLYKSGDEAVRLCLVNATLEHLFENRGIASYFGDWKKDPILSHAFSDALLWSKKGGKSPLS